MTKYEIAKRLGISHQAVYHWYSGKAHPSSQHLLALSKMLDKSIEDILKEMKQAKSKRSK
jgi:DNA-binding XRE family transcriptional regulator